MRRVAGAMLAVMLSSAALAQAPATPRPFIASYEVTYRGMGAGELTFELSQTDENRYAFETRANPSFLAKFVVSSAAIERSTLEIGPTGVRPVEWRLEDGKSGDQGDGVVNFDWTRKLASGVLDGKRFEMPLEPRTQDRSSIQIAIAAMLLKGEQPGVVPMIDGKRLKTYTYTPGDATKIASPLGEIEAVIYESTRQNSSRLSRLWLAPQIDYLPVRAEQWRKGKMETVMVLKEWQRK